MKKCIVMLIVAIAMLSQVSAEWDALQLGMLKEQHREMLDKCSYQTLRDGRFEMRMAPAMAFSIFYGEAEASVYSMGETTKYLLYAKKQDQKFGITVNLTLHIVQDEQNVVVKARLLKTNKSFEFKLDGDNPEGYEGDALLNVAMQMGKGEWWAGLLNFDPATLERTTYYSTKSEAVRHVPTHVSPKDCFVWGSGSQWMVIPGTGCAHWVAHQKGITGGSAGCYVSKCIRVSDVVSGKTQYSLSNARVGDIWTNTSLSHCGMVRSINRDESGRASVYVQHCSSGSGGVVYSTFTSGYAYR